MELSPLSPPVSDPAASPRFVPRAMGFSYSFAGTLVRSLLVAALALGVPSEGSAKRGKGRAGDKRKRPGPDKTTPVSPPVPPPTASNLPLAAVRLACDLGPSSGLCDAAFSAASTAAARRYTLIETPKLEALFAREPSLRGCRNDSCRMAIAEQLNLWRLIDVIVHSPRQKELSASVSIFDPAARGIAADVERESKRDPVKLEGTVSEAVEQVIATQRLTAQLRLDVRTADAKVKIIDSRGGVRELSESERSGKTPVRLFLGGYTVHADKPGFLAQDLPVTVTQTGASIQVELQLRPIEVRFEWEPKDAVVRVDNRQVSAGYPVMELSEGPHRVEVLAPPGKPYESTVRDLDVRRDMEPVRLLLQRLTELRIQVPRGYSVSVDNQILPAERFTERGLQIETSHKTTPGLHSVSATSFRGLQLTRLVEVRPSSSADAVIRSPALWPGAVLLTAGLLTAGAGVGLYLNDGRCVDQDCLFVTNYAPAGYSMMAVGGAAFVSGLIWLGYNASHHPRFYSPSSQRVSILPSFSPRYSGVLTAVHF
jgi:hypothetical protein